ncbi:hypothetical protein NLU66_08180 [Brachybacterium sp. NBEC-018]|uniref:hypothetical protein n=1 Tax=Brachybacterium sp. NBEC-018 TaxID=2996004 RepID=UPI002175580E|nr:hypothetical protein [Brachybacterium sp. NBEC-018]UVY85554.1 hypothetical protein NLU66_08180 [Brachybacterium sp. NBEC-018]
MLLDGVIYQSSTITPKGKGNVVLISVDRIGHKVTREIPIGENRTELIEPTATIHGERAEALVVLDDGRVDFGLSTYPRRWPADVPLSRWGMPERAGDGFWVGKVEISELSDIDDGIPDEWRPFLPVDGL